MKVEGQLAPEWFERARRFALFGRAWSMASGDPDLAGGFRTLLSVADRLEQGRNRMALVGLFSAGKTTFLNGLMQEGDDIRLPTGLGETTAIPTVVRPADRHQLLLWQEGELVEAPDLIRKEFLELTRDTIGPILKMYLQTQTELIFLAPLDESMHDIEFLDLPGLMGQESRLDDIALRGTRCSDGVMYVVNAKQGLTRTDAGFIEGIEHLGAPIVVIVTHLDLVPPTERRALVENLRNRLKELKADIVGIVETKDRAGSLTMSGTQTLFRHFMPKLDNRVTLTRNIRAVMQSLSRRLQDAGTYNRGADPYGTVLWCEGQELAKDAGINTACFQLPSQAVPGEIGSEAFNAMTSLAPAIKWLSGLPSPKSLLAPTATPRLLVIPAEDGTWKICLASVEDNTVLGIDSHVNVGSPTTPLSKPNITNDLDPCVRQHVSTLANSPSGNHRVGYNKSRVFVGQRAESLFDRATDAHQITNVAVSDQGTVVVGGSSLIKYFGGPGSKTFWADRFRSISFLRCKEHWVANVMKGGRHFIIEAQPPWNRLPSEDDRLGPYDTVRDLSTCDSPSWGAAVSNGSEYHVLVNGKVVAGPFCAARAPVFPVTGDRWAAIVKVESGWTIAASQGSDSGTVSLARTFDEVSAPQFLADGRVLFAAVRNGIGTLETM